MEAIAPPSFLSTPLIFLSIGFYFFSFHTSLTTVVPTRFRNFNGKYFSFSIKNQNLASHYSNILHRFTSTPDAFAKFKPDNPDSFIC